MPTTRREFLSTIPATAIAISPSVRMDLIKPTPKKLKILILGGTRFLGPPFVEAAMAKGHEVTLFNRGKTNPGLFPKVELLRGDRDTGDLESLKGRSWDAVVDNCGYVPAHVAATSELLKDKVDHYQFISSLSVYGYFETRPQVLDESAAVETIPDEVAGKVKTIREAFQYYGALKVRCEQAAQTAMPGRVGTIRPGLIVGPLDPTDRFTWWPVRMNRGGKVLAPANPNTETQFIDARDLAQWMLTCIEQNVFGVYNATGFDGLTSMQDVLSACKCATSANVELVWVEEAFLRQQRVRAYSELPLWIPREGLRHLPNDKAKAKGLTFRPISETIRDTLRWARLERGDQPYRAGLTAAREAQVLQAWGDHRRAAASHKK